MKTLQQILAQQPVYLHEWSKEQLFQDFEGYDAEGTERDLTQWKDCKILFASYTYIDYSGNAFVLFEKNGELFEVNGSHCSCYGLEGQFEPEKTNLLELKNDF